MAGSQSIDLVETGAGVRSGPLSATRERGPDLNLVFPHTPSPRSGSTFVQPIVAGWCAQSGRLVRQSGYVANSRELLR